MNRQDFFLKKLGVLEGGTVVDSGGLTNFGISQNAYPDEDIENMTPERARFLFSRDYYIPLCIDEYTCPYTAFQILSFGINVGVLLAYKTYLTLTILLYHGLVFFILLPA